MFLVLFFFFQAEDGIRDLVRSRGLGDVYKRQDMGAAEPGRNRLLTALDKSIRAGITERFVRSARALSLIHI